jgi:hypothetical protein
VLAADTGVTKTDLEVWKNHVCPARGSRAEGRLVALNKIDTLWDELSNDAAIAAAIARQSQDSARVLGIGKNQVIAVSAQKGLLGKIKSDYALIERSGLPFGQGIGRYPGTSGTTLTRDTHLLHGRNHQRDDFQELNAVAEQIAELQALSGENRDAIHDLVTRLRDEKQAYDQTLVSFQNMRAVLSDQVKILLDYLSVEAFDGLAEKTRQGMAESWTTPGLREGMKISSTGPSIQWKVPTNRPNR